MSSGGSSAHDRHHLGAVDHHIGDFEIAKVEQAAEHVAVELLDAALAVQQVDRAAQFLMRRENRLIFADADAGKRSQQPAHQRFDAHQGRPEQADGPCNRPRDRQRNALRRIDGERSSAAPR